MAAGSARDVRQVEHRGRREDVLEVLRVRVLEAMERRVRVVLREARLLRTAPHRIRITVVEEAATAQRVVYSTMDEYRLRVSLNIRRK